jgi:hypothetical protein
MLQHYLNSLAVGQCFKEVIQIDVRCYQKKKN